MNSVSYSFTVKSKPCLCEYIFSENYSLQCYPLVYYKQRGEGKFHAVAMDTVEFQTQQQMFEYEANLSSKDIATSQFPELLKKMLLCKY